MEKPQYLIFTAEQLKKKLNEEDNEVIQMLFTKADDVVNAGKFRDALYEALYRADYNRLVEEVIPSMSRTLLLKKYDVLTVEDWATNIYIARDIDFILRTREKNQLIQNLFDTAKFINPTFRDNLYEALYRANDERFNYLKQPMETTLLGYDNKIMENIVDARAFLADVRNAMNSIEDLKNKYIAALYDYRAIPILDVIKKLKNYYSLEIDIEQIISERKKSRKKIKSERDEYIAKAAATSGVSSLGCESRNGHYK
jgi:hypothetical protein